MELEIEHLLFKMVEKPKNHLMTKVINLWDDRYRINVYVHLEEEGLTKKRISSSYFCRYNNHELTILLPKDFKPLD